MAGVRLEFAQFGHFDYFNIYRNSVSTAIENLGQPIGVSSTMYYEDLTVEPNRDYYYRAGVIRDSVENFSEEFHVKTLVEFDPPYDLVVEFKSDETNRLELNWKLDGFVDEQRYYCSETPIDTENLPAPKAVLANGVRSYVDAAVDVGKTYYIRVGAVKNGIEKISSEIFAGGDIYFDNVTLLIDADGGYLNLINNTAIANNSNTVVTKEVANVLPKFSSDSFLYVNRRAITANFVSSLGSIFTIEVVGFPNFSNTLNWANWLSVGDTYCVRNNNLSQLTFGRTGKTPTFDSGAKAVTARESIHVCIMSDGVNICTFINGVLVRTYAYSAMTASSLIFNGDFSSYIEAVRVTNSITRYSMSGFTPPVEKFPTQ